MKDQIIGLNIKQKMRIIRWINIDIFSNQILLETIRFFVLVYLNQDSYTKRFKAKTYHLTKGVIDKYSVIVNGKDLYDQAIDSDITRYEEIRKLTTG